MHAVPLGHASSGTLKDSFIVLHPDVRGVVHRVTKRMVVTAPDELYVPPLGTWLAR